MGWIRVKRPALLGVLAVWFVPGGLAQAQIPQGPPTGQPPPRTDSAMQPVSPNLINPPRTDWVSQPTNPNLISWANSPPFGPPPAGTYPAQPGQPPAGTFTTQGGPQQPQVPAGAYPAQIGQPQPQQPPVTYPAQPGQPQPQPDFVPVTPDHGAPPPPAPAACTQAPFTPYMLGDFGRVLGNTTSDAKIGEGESPRPIDRVFFKFNYFSNVDPSHFNQNFEPVHNVDLYRYTFGFEKTFCDGRFSVGLRVPVNTIDADGKAAALIPAPFGTGTMVRPGGQGLDDTVFGNVSIIAKAVLCEDRATGSLVSAGAVVTFPTEDVSRLNPGNSSDLVLQPFAGFILNRGSWFVQGFTSVTLPVTRTQPAVWYNDLGIGYYMYRCTSSGLLTAVVPTAEVHVTTPLRQFEGSFDAGRPDDVVDFTLGTTFEFVHHTTLGIGVVAPVTGPKPFDIGALAQLNYRF
jgi:hypothetical protein